MIWLMSHKFDWAAPGSHDVTVAGSTRPVADGLEVMDHPGFPPARMSGLSTVVVSIASHGIHEIKPPINDDMIRQIRANPTDCGPRAGRCVDQKVAQRTPQENERVSIFLFAPWSSNLFQSGFRL